MYNGAACQAARCVPAIDTSDPSVGAGCSLELIGAGPLPNPGQGGGTVLSAPAIAATPTGFVIAYREIDPNGSAGRVKTVPIDNGGGAIGVEANPDTPGPLRLELTPCSDSDATDGVGLLVSGDTTLIALAKQACGATAQLQLFNLKFTPPKLVLSEAGTLPINLGAARPVAARPLGNILVFAEGGVGRIAAIDGDRGIISPSGCDTTKCNFGGPRVTDTWVAASNTILALLAAGEGPSTPSEEDGSAGGGSPVDSGDPIGDSTLRLLMLPAATPLEQIESARPLATPYTFPGKFASIAAQVSRVIVVSDGTGPGRSVTYRAFDYGAADAADVGGFSIEGPTDVTAADVAVLGNRAYFVALKQAAIELHVFENATTIMTPLSRVSFGREPRISAISTVRDGRVAVAATDKRVAAVWTTGKKLEPNDPAGGYAVFACTK